MMNLNPKFIRNCANVTRSSRGLPSKDSACIIVKETPNKDAITTTSLAIMSGNLMKKNEQGAWQNRYCAIVPHLFLYYYENDTSENPRGIIDLEFYTRIHIDNENHLTLSPTSNIPIRSFYFHSKDSENPQMVEEWMTKLQRDRYDVIKDERDAYKQLQDEYTGEMNVASKLIETKTDENNQLQNQLKIFRSQYNTVLDTLEFVLQQLKDFDEFIHHLNFTNTSNCNSTTNHKSTSNSPPVENHSFSPAVLASNLRQLVLQEDLTLSSYRDQITENITSSTKYWEKTLLDIEQSYHRAIRTERQLLVEIENERQRLHETENTIQELMRELQRSQSSQLLVLQTHRERHQRHRAEKKLLVQEVKSLRAQLHMLRRKDSSSNKIDDAPAAKASTTIAAPTPTPSAATACNGSDRGGGSVSVSISGGRDAAGNGHSKEHTSTATGTASTTTPETMRRPSPTEGQGGMLSAVPSTGGTPPSKDTAATAATDNVSIKSSSAAESLSDIAVDRLPVTPSTLNGMQDNKITFIPSEYLPSSSSSSSAISSQLLSIFHKPSMGFLPAKHGSTSSSPPSQSPPNTSRHSSLDSSFDPAHALGYLHHDTAAASAASRPTTAPRSYSSDSPPVPTNLSSSSSSSSSSAIKARCLRCGGTLEGPKHSTCHCESPVVSDDSRPSPSTSTSTSPLTVPSVSPLKGIGLGAYFNQLFIKESSSNSSNIRSNSSSSNTASDNQDALKDVQMKEVIKFSSSSPVEDSPAIVTMNQITS